MVAVVTALAIWLENPIDPDGGFLYLVANGKV
jgi:hypothetical protein